MQSPQRQNKNGRDIGSEDSARLQGDVELGAFPPRSFDDIRAITTSSSRYSPTPHVGGVASSTTASSGFSGPDPNMRDSSAHGLTPSASASVDPRSSAQKPKTKKKKRKKASRSHARLPDTGCQPSELPSLTDDTQTNSTTFSASRTSHLSTHDSGDDNDATLQCTISQPGERSLQARRMFHVAQKEQKKLDAAKRKKKKVAKGRQPQPSELNTNSMTLSGSRTSRPSTHSSDANDDTLQSTISQPGERSLQARPRRMFHVAQKEQKKLDAANKRTKSSHRQPSELPSLADDANANSTTRIPRLGTHGSSDDYDAALQGTIAQSGDRSLQAPAARPRRIFHVAQKEQKKLDAANKRKKGSHRQPSELSSLTDDANPKSTTLSASKTSRLRTHGSSDDYDAALQSTIAQSGERSLQAPAARTNRMFHVALQEQKKLDVDETHVGSLAIPGSEPDTQGAERVSKPSENTAARHRLELAPAREQGPQDLVGRPRVGVSAVFDVQEENRDTNPQSAPRRNGTPIAPNLQPISFLPPVHDHHGEDGVEGGAEYAAQPGAFRVGADDDESVDEGTVWGGVDSTDQTGVEAPAGNDDEDLLSAELVDPEADRLQLHAQMEQILGERLGLQGSKEKVCCIICGVNFSKRTSQLIAVLCILVVSLGVALLVATGVVLPQPAVSSTPATSQVPTTAPVAPSASPSVPNAQWLRAGDDIVGERMGDQSGWSVALSSGGTILAVGSHQHIPLNSVDGRPFGQVRVYINTGGNWTQLGEDLNGAAPSDEFGFSVALSANGTTLAVGAVWADGANGVNSGRATVYSWNGNVWEARGSSIEGQGRGDEFGFSIAISDDGTVWAAGAWKNDNGGARPKAGHVRVFGWNGTDWSQMGDNLEGSSAGDRFGDAVTLSSDGLTLACNANRWGTDSGGYVRAYRWSGETWILRGRTLSGFVAADRSGVSVSLSGDGMVLAVGAGKTNSCRVYGYDGTDWAEIAQTIRPADAVASPTAQFGYGVALSFAGDTVVIGAIRNNYTESVGGTVLVYRLTFNREEWVQVGQVLTGGAGDRFGASVAISENGNRVAVGANQRGTAIEAADTPAGYVRVFDLQE